MAVQQFLSPNANRFGRAHSYMAADPRGDYQQESLMGARREAGANQRAALQAGTARDALAASQGRFSTLLPLLQGGLAQGGDGGQSTAGPGITAGPIWSGQQIKEQGNAAQGRNNASTQSQQKGMQQSFAGRGFGSNSPLLQALNTGLDMNRMKQNAEDVREINWGSAQGNAQHLLASQQAQEDQHANRMMEDIERRKINSNYRVGLLGMLAGLA
jgi:hypothetical protein